MEGVRQGHIPDFEEPMVRSTFWERFHTCLKNWLVRRKIGKYGERTHVLYDGSTPSFAARRTVMSIRSQTRST